MPILNSVSSQYPRSIAELSMEDRWRDILGARYQLLIGGTFQIHEMESFFQEQDAEHRIGGPIGFIPPENIIESLQEKSVYAVHTLLLLIRMSDLLPNPREMHWFRRLNVNVDRYIKAINAFRLNSGANCMILMIPESGDLSVEQYRECLLAEIRFRQMGGVNLLEWNEYIRKHEPTPDSSHHMPFTPQGQRKLGEFILDNLEQNQMLTLLSNTHYYYQRQGRLKKLSLRADCRRLSSVDDFISMEQLSRNARFHASGHVLQGAEFIELAERNGQVMLGIDVMGQQDCRTLYGFVSIQCERIPIIKEFILHDGVRSEQIASSLLRTITLEAKRSHHHQLGIVTGQGAFSRWLRETVFDLQDVCHERDGVFYLPVQALLNVLTDHLNDQGNNKIDVFIPTHCLRN